MAGAAAMPLRLLSMLPGTGGAGGRRIDEGVLSSCRVNTWVIGDLAELLDGLDCRAEVGGTLLDKRNPLPGLVRSAVIGPDKKLLLPRRLPGLLLEFIF